MGIVKSIFYSLHALLTYNALFNFVVGNRGAGKTYGAKKWAIKAFLATGAQFIYLRRYKSELKTVGKFFDDIAHEFPGVKFEVKGNNFYINDKFCGLAVPLSNAMVLKSTSMPLVDKIIFDEFVIDTQGHLKYLKNEVVAFLELYETIFRTRDNGRVLFLSNAVSVVNPYFLFWGIRPKKNKRFTRFNNGLILVEFVENQDFIDAKYKTKFGQLIKGTEYGDYAVENKFLVDNDSFVGKMGDGFKPIARMHYRGRDYGLWVNYKVGVFQVSDKFDPSVSFHYTLTDSDHKPNMMLVKSKSKGFYLDKFIHAYENGYCQFDNLEVKNQALEMFKLLKA